MGWTLLSHRLPGASRLSYILECSQGKGTHTHTYTESKKRGSPEASTKHTRTHVRLVWREAWNAPGACFCQAQTDPNICQTEKREQA